MEPENFTPEKNIFQTIIFRFYVTLQGTNISPKNGVLKMMFLFPRWDMLIPWRVIFQGVYIYILYVSLYIYIYMYTPKSYLTMFLCFILHLDLPCFFISWFRQSWSLQRVPSRELVPCISGCSQRKKGVSCFLTDQVIKSRLVRLGYIGNFIKLSRYIGIFWWAILRIPH